MFGLSPGLLLKRQINKERPKFKYTSNLLALAVLSALYVGQTVPYLNPIKIWESSYLIKSSIIQLFIKPQLLHLQKL